MSCTHIGSTNADIAGLGVVLALAIQGGISLILSVWSYFIRDVEEGGMWASTIKALRRNQCTDETRNELYRSKRVTIDKILASAADTQLLTGIALLVSSLIERNSLSLYHFHVVYDTVNFTSVSCCAALLACLTHREENRLSRFVSIVIFSALYLAFSIEFGIHLQTWSLTEPKRCYNTRLIATSDAKHPYVDQIYLGVTCLYMFAALYGSIGIEETVTRKLKNLHKRPPELQLGLNRDFQYVFSAAQNVGERMEAIGKDLPVKVSELLAPILGPTASKVYADVLLGNLMHMERGSDGEIVSVSLVDTRRAVLYLSLIQYPVHLYSVFALRASNEHLLTGESENVWGFGQIVALVMLAQTIIDGLRSAKEYNQTKRLVMTAENLAAVADNLRKPSGIATPTRPSQASVGLGTSDVNAPDMAHRTSFSSEYWRIGASPTTE